jgi:hypothetical protein
MRGGLSIDVVGRPTCSSCAMTFSIDWGLSGSAGLGGAGRWRYRATRSQETNHLRGASCPNLPRNQTIESDWL